MPDEPLDVDTLPPTQYLILEVLAARHRLGESTWTFPARLRPSLDRLADADLIWWKHGVMPNSALAGLTDAGRAAALFEGYEPPRAAGLGPDEAAVAVLVAHQRANISSCVCGWAELGKSHPAHQVAMLREAAALPPEERIDG